MTQNTVLHLLFWDKKFVPPFVQLIREHFPEKRHRFVIYGVGLSEAAALAADDVAICPSLLKNVGVISQAIRDAERVIVHSLLNNHLLYVLALQPRLLRKIYWVIWGADLYVHQSERRDWRWKKDELLRRFVISRMGHLVTYIEGDAELARKWYGARGKYSECIMYLSNVYREYEVKRGAHDGVNIQIGNSADPSNNHLEMLEKLALFREENITIWAPLSYGDEAYARRVAEAGKKIFGDKFRPMTDFMPFAEYLKFLGKIDVAVFNHRRQQAMGNTITLLGLGKKVYLRSDITSWGALEGIGAEIYDSARVEVTLLDPEVQARNRRVVKTHFSLETLVKQWRDIFEK